MDLKKVYVVVLILISVFATSLAYAKTSEEVSVIVGFRSHIDEQIIQSFGGKAIEKFNNFPFVTVQIPKNAIKNLEKNKNIEFVEQDANWNLLSQSTPWNISALSVEDMHSNGISGDGVKVGVLDTGIRIHEDLRIMGGWNFINNSSNYSDDHGHGTHVAGIIAALNNNVGVVGVAPECQLYALKVLDKNGVAKWSTVAKAIDWAMSNKLNILNMSFGGLSGSKAIEKAIYKANKSGILLVAAAGNDGIKQVFYPAKYASVIAVGATDSNNNIASFSNWGEDIELVAPGVNIYSTYTANGYQSLSGTSMAAPHVTGVAALVLSQDRKLTNVNIREQLKSTTIDLGVNGYDSTYGYGLVQARMQ